MQKWLIIGLGSGRCGTLSLAMLLARQRDSVCEHEMMPVMPKDLPAKRVIWRARHMLSRAGEFQGDVAVWYLPHVGVLADHFPEVRFISLQREKADCVESIRRKWALQNINPIQPHDGVQYRRDFPYVPPLEAAMPTYPMDWPIEQAISQFYDDYYEECRRLQGLYPTTFRIFPMQFLNAEDGVRHILTFAGFAPESMRVIVGVRSNTLADIRERLIAAYGADSLVEQGQAAEGPS